MVTQSVFTAVHLTLFQVKRRDRNPAGIMTVPIWSAVCGFLVSAAFIVVEAVRLLGAWTPKN